LHLFFLGKVVVFGAPVVIAEIVDELLRLCLPSAVPPCGEIPAKIAEGAGLIILLAQLFVGQHGLRFVHLLKLLLETFNVIGMVFLGEGVIGVLDLPLGGLLIDAKNAVVVLLRVKFVLVKKASSAFR